MSFPSKKYFFILVSILVCYLCYWVYFTPSWEVVIDKNHTWKYSFQSSDIPNYKNIQWSDPKSSEDISYEEGFSNLLFQTEFTLDNPANVIEGILEYPFRYSARIFINGVLYADLDRNLISPNLKKDQLIVDAYWKPREVNLDHSFLQNHLNKGTNTITLAVYNVKELKSLRNTKMFLSFLYKRRIKHVLTEVSVTKKTHRVFSSSSLPIMAVNTKNQLIPDEPKIRATLNVFNNKIFENSLSDSSSLYSIAIERRGNTSQTFAKKSYSFNIRGQGDKKKATSLLGLPPSKKWVLYGPYADKSLIRNVLTYSLYRQMGNYSPRTRFVELVINNNYQGIYVLAEKIQIGPNHLNIPKLKIDKQDSSLISGGYLIELDRSPWKSYFPLNRDSSSPIPVSYFIYDFKRGNITSLLKKKIEDQFYQLERHIYDNDNIYDYLDIRTFIDYFIITEFTKNIDGYCLSTFMYAEDIQPKSSKYYIGPIWDYNFSLGLANYHEGYKTEGYVYNSSKYIPFWWHTLLRDSIFCRHLENRYYELRKTVLSNKNINQNIDTLYNICKNSADLNFKKWTVLGSSELWPNYYIGKTYEDEIKYLKGWIKKRLEFLDQDILAKKKKTKKYYEVLIRNDPEWIRAIQNKANKRNISLQEMIEIDAQYMAKNNQR